MIRVVLPHILLVTVAFGYAYIGAIIFASIEEPYWQLNRDRQMNNLKQIKLLTIDRFYRQLSNSSDDQLLDNIFNDYVDVVYDIQQEGIISSDDLIGNARNQRWQQSVTLFWTISMLSTIG